jgi:hypothetical protein
MSHCLPVLTALVLLLARSGALGADDIDAYVEAQTKQQRMPGLALAAVKAGKVVFDWRVEPAGRR